MGGPGSGCYSRYGSKQTTESQPFIDIRWLKANGYFQDGSAGILCWNLADRYIGSIAFETEALSIVLKYAVRFGDGRVERIEQRIHFTETACNFGGQRRWFICPGCGRRVGLLYCPGKIFVCRHCSGMTYASRQEGQFERMIRRTKKIRNRLKSTDADGLKISRPKGMHQLTYLNLLARLKKYESQGWAALASKLSFL